MILSISKDNTSAWDSQEEKEPQVSLVGDGFTAGAEGNSEIDGFLGFESQVLGGVAHRHVSELEADVQWVPSPNYCEDDALCCDLLEERGVVVQMTQTTDTRKQRANLKPFVEEHLAMFDLEGELCVTLPFETEEQAVACALWHVLQR